MLEAVIGKSNNPVCGLEFQKFPDLTRAFAAVMEFAVIGNGYNLVDCFFLESFGIIAGKRDQIHGNLKTKQK
jgi:hypothetical protein